MLWLGKIERGLPTTDRVIPPKKTLTSKEITVSFNVKKLWLPVLLFVAALTTVFLTWSPWKKEKVVPAPTDKPSIAILNFKNSTGDKNLEHWREGLSIMLTTDLSQSKHIHVLSTVQTYGVLKRLNLIDTVNYSPEDLEKIANQGGVNHLLTGSYAKAGNTFLINISLFSMNTGELLRRHRLFRQDVFADSLFTYPNQ